MCARAMPTTVYVAVDRHLLGSAVMRARACRFHRGAGGREVQGSLVNY